MEDWFIPYQASPLNGARRVLILAPHPDDEVFGCGGAAALYRQQGADVSVLVLTDGAGQAPASDRAAIFATRQAETNEALSVLGVAPATFWGLADRSLGGAGYLAARLAEHIRVNAFDQIFTPDLSEVHPDHEACTRNVLAALELLQAQGHTLPEVALYEVGAPLMPNWLLDISEVWPLKAKAMQCFVSQQASQDYARHVAGLNAYRTYTLDKSITHAEAYRTVSADELRGQYADERGSLHPPRRWVDSVLCAAEATAEAMQARLVAQNLFVDQLHSLLRDERAQFASQMREMSAQLSDKVLQLNAIQWQVDHQAEEIRTLTTQISIVQNAHQELLHSRSWRLTEPLRGLARLLKTRR